MSQRHTILIVLVTCIFAAAGFRYLAHLAIWAWHTEAVSRRTVRFLSPLVGAGAGESFVRGMRTVNPWVLVAIWTLIVMSVAVPRNFRSLHEERAGHKAAGLWMKDNVEADWQIVDPFGWAEWYTGGPCDRSRTRTQPRARACTRVRAKRQVAALAARDYRNGQEPRGRT